MLKKLLLRAQHRSRLWAALAALFVGTTLLLLSVLIWWDFSELLYGKSKNDSLGSTFLVIGKRVTEQNMGNAAATVFSPQEIADLQKAPQVQNIGEIIGNHFPVYASIGGRVALQTDLPLESVPDKFIDKMPSDWQWQPGSLNLPIIISSQFLDIYNYVLAPSQGLPQLSESSVKSVAMNLKVGNGDHIETFSAHVVGFSDRIGSVLAPLSFIEYGNKMYGMPGMQKAPSQLIIRTQDPSDTRFGAYLKQHDYTTNSENLRWSRIRAIVEVVASATGILALLLMGIGTMVFILFIELTIARAQQSLTLLLEIGYGPRFLSRFMTARFLPLVLGTVTAAMIVTIIGQAVASSMIKAQGLELPPLPGWQVWAALIASTSILIILVTRSISNAIAK
jgi:hypothetical protein